MRPTKRWSPTLDRFLPSLPLQSVAVKRGSSQTLGRITDMEPLQLKRGKEFHLLVQSDWGGEIEGQTVRPEMSILLSAVRRTSGTAKRGRMDIFVDKIHDFVTVVEIKATDWDAIKARNSKRLLGSHRRQVLKYVDKYLEEDHVSVCAGIIYPRAPRSVRIRQEVESYLNDYALQVVWFEENGET